MKIKCSRTPFLNKRGFTLIELLVVVLIIGILAAVALPQYQKAVKKAQGAEALVAIESLAQAVSMAYLDRGSYALNQDVLDTQLPELKYFKYSFYSLGNPNYEEGGESSSFTRLVDMDPYAPGMAQIYLVYPKYGISVRVQWNRGKQDRTMCSVLSTSSSSCGDFFNCNWEKPETPPFDDICYLD